MSITNLHGIFAVNLDVDGMGAPVVVGGITQQSLSTGSTIRGEASSGEAYPRFNSLVSQAPGVAFTTMALKMLLDEIGTTGLKVAAAVNTGLTLYGQKHDNGGVRAGAASHISYNIKQGRVIPVGISADHLGDASLTVAVPATYDGTNDPVVKANSVTLPTGLVDSERFTLGPISIGGVTIDQVRSVSIAFGVNATAEGSDSDLWPTHLSVRSITPSISISGVNSGWFDAAVIPMQGIAATHLNTEIYLRKRADGGVFVADGTAEHIKITTAGMAVVDTIADGSGNEPSTSTITMALKFDGTNDPLVINTASAIT